MNDGTLLQQFRTGNHEDSFREIVQRHLGLVRGVAGRTLGGMVDAGAIDDVAMRVFATMARKAESLESRPSLAGWLVVATRQEALRLSRNERTRQAAMSAFAQEKKSGSTTPHEPAWQEAQPHLDEALAKLPEAEREAVMLRFYEDKGFREISAVLGRGEDAARKRVGAALGKMSIFLRRRGVVLPAAVLGAGLASSLKTEAAAGAASVFAKALACASTRAPWSLAGALQSHPAAAVLAALLVVAAATGGGYALGHSSFAHPQRTASPESEATAATGMVPGLLGKKTAAIPPASFTLEQLAAELVRRRRIRAEPGAASYDDLLNEVSPDQCDGLIALLDARHGKDFHVHADIVSDVFRRWARAEPRVAGDAAVQRWKSGACEIWQARRLLWFSMDEWGKHDGPAAMAWLEAQQLPDATSQSLAQTLFGSMAKAEPAAAVETLAGMSWEERHAWIKEVSVPEDVKGRALFTGKLAAIPDEETRAEIFAGTFARQSSLTLTEFQSLNFTRSDAGWSAMRVMADRMTEADHSPQRALDFLWINAPEEARPVICRDQLAALRRKDPLAAAAWMQAHGLTESSVAAALQSLERK